MNEMHSSATATYIPPPPPPPPPPVESPAAEYLISSSALATAIQTSEKEMGGKEPPTGCLFLSITPCNSSSTSLIDLTSAASDEEANCQCQFYGADSQADSSEEFNSSNKAEFLSANVKVGKEDTAAVSFLSASCSYSQEDWRANPEKDRQLPEPEFKLKHLGEFLISTSFFNTSIPKKDQSSPAPPASPTQKSTDSETLISNKLFIFTAPLAEFSNYCASYSFSNMLALPNKHSTKSSFNITRSHSSTTFVSINDDNNNNSSPSVSSLSQQHNRKLTKEQTTNSQRVHDCIPEENNVDTASSKARVRFKSESSLDRISSNNRNKSAAKPKKKHQRFHSSHSAENLKLVQTQKRYQKATSQNGAGETVGGQISPSVIHAGRLLDHSLKTSPNCFRDLTETKIIKMSRKMKLVACQIVITFLNSFRAINLQFFQKFRSKSRQLN